jgi:hypothetical protein
MVEDLENFFIIAFPINVPNVKPQITKCEITHKQNQQHKRGKS